MILDRVLRAIQDLGNVSPSTEEKEGHETSSVRDANDCFITEETHEGGDLLVAKRQLKREKEEVLLVIPFSSLDIGTKVIDPAFTTLLGFAIGNMLSNFSPSWFCVNPFSIIEKLNEQEVLLQVRGMLERRAMYHTRIDRRKRMKVSPVVSILWWRDASSRASVSLPLRCGSWLLSLVVPSCCGLSSAS